MRTRTQDPKYETARYFPLFRNPPDRRWEIIDKHDSPDTNGWIKQPTQFYEPDRGYASAFISLACPVIVPISVARLSSFLAS